MTYRIDATALTIQLYIFILHLIMIALNTIKLLSIIIFCLSAFPAICGQTINDGNGSGQHSDDPSDDESEPDEKRFRVDSAQEEEEAQPSDTMIPLEDSNELIELPDDMWRLILALLGPGTRLRAELVSHRWQDLLARLPPSAIADPVRRVARMNNLGGGCMAPVVVNGRIFVWTFQFGIESRLRILDAATFARLGTAIQLPTNLPFPAFAYNDRYVFILSFFDSTNTLRVIDAQNLRSLEPTDFVVRREGTGQNAVIVVTDINGLELARVRMRDCGQNVLNHRIEMSPVFATTFLRVNEAPALILSDRDTNQIIRTINFPQGAWLAVPVLFGYLLFVVDRTAGTIHIFDISGYL